MKGINLTMPHKIAVLPYLDEISPAARIIGAVNTVVVREGRLIGDNTDGKGFVQALQMEQVPLEGKKVVLLGAGGAAKAIAVECALAGAASVTIFNRSAAPRRRAGPNSPGAYRRPGFLSALGSRTGHSGRN